MIELIPLLGFGGVTALAGAAAFARSLLSRRRARVEWWREAARRAGLSEVVEEPGSRLAGGSLAGRSGGLAVRFEHDWRGRSERGTRILIEGLGHGAEGLSLRRGGLPSHLFGDEIEIGDRAFDRAVHVQGPAPLALALLDPPTRKQLPELLRGKVAQLHGSWIPLTLELDRGVLVVRLEDCGIETAERLALALQGALAAAPLLAAPEDLPTRLADNYRNEAEAGVRLKIVTVLARELPDHPATRRTLLAACRDASTEISLRAATALGADGSDAYLALVDDPATEDSLAAEAVAALGDRLSLHQLKTTLARAVRIDRWETAQACLESLARRGHAPAEGQLLELLAQADPAAALAAARALGRVGTVAAVAPLREHAAAALPSALRGAARQAIVDIQTRLTGAAPGQLTLAEDAAGALSLASGTEGGLSLAGENRTAPPAGGEAGGARQPEAENG
jgi:hypothetical protein